LACAYTAGQGWPNERAVVESIKAAINPMSTTSNPLASPASFDLADFVRPLTIIGKLANLRRVPSRTRAIAATAGSAAFWAGEAQPRRISRLTLQGEILEQLSIVAILITSVELLQSSSPSAEVTLSRDIGAAAAQALDLAFIDIDNAGEENARPASITNGVTPIVSAGATLANIDSDLAKLVQALSDAGSDLMDAVWVLNPRTALYLARLRGTGGALAFPGLSVLGGELLGLPAITSASVPMSIGSPGAGQTSITLLDQSQILLADDGAGSFSVMDKGSLQMEPEPGSGAQAMVSLFQTNSAALRVVRHANWKRCRDGMAQVLSEVAY
jgi:HK97 family phage major capsid protein